MKKILLSIIAIVALAPAVQAWNGHLHTAVAAKIIFLVIFL